MITQLFLSMALVSCFGCSETGEQSTSARTESIPPSAPAERRSSIAADQAYERGKQLMEQHCGDCYQRSTAGLLEAVSHLRRAIALGRQDADAHRLLRDAYNALAYVDYRHDQTRRRPYEQLLHDEIRIIAKLDPADVANRTRYVDLLDSAADKISELDSMLATSPTYAPAHYRLTQLLLAAGEIERAGDHAKRWLSIADARELSAYSDQIFESADEGHLRKLVEADPTLHPASFELAKRALWERRDVKNGVRLARAAIEGAPPIVASDYLSVLETFLKEIEQHQEAEALRSHYAAKAKTGEALRRQLY